MFPLCDVPAINPAGLIVIQDVAGNRLAICTTLAMISMKVKMQAKVHAITKDGDDVIITVSNWSSF